MELKEAKELEQDQMQNLHEEDFAVSDDEDEAEREEDAKMNLGVSFLAGIHSSLESWRRKFARM